MNRIVTAAVAGIVAVVCMGAGTPARNARPVLLARVPNGGIQPQAVAAPNGTVHLVYFSGNPQAGDLYYCKADSGAAKFSAPIRVNSQPGSAVAVGTIRGGQLALGRNGRVHVAWNGSGQAAPRHSDGGSPLLYARLNDSGTGFEPQRNLMGKTVALDGGCTVTADSAGGVFVFWHAGQVKGQGEESRRFYVARSTDDGATFSAETIADQQRSGACPCCGTRAFADSKGRLYVLYRGAMERVNRDMILLVSGDNGRSFKGGEIHPWKVPT